tara:strand:- start:268 stop:1821 length:1554 start_codon:yes stop_codon:yes gene_type:complete
MKSLTIGITNLNPTWDIILNQIGPPYLHINNSSFNTLNKHACIIINSNSTLIKDDIFKYINEGGGVIIESKIAKKLFKISTRNLFVKYVNTKFDKIFSRVTSGIINSTLIVSKNSKFLKDQYGRFLVDTLNIGKGYVIIIPSDLINCIKSIENKRKNFPTYSNFFPNERVSTVSKRTLREIIYISLLEIYNKKNIPFLSLNSFPNAHKTIFNFRVDTDFAEKKQIEKLYSLCKEFNINATWFVETKSSKNWINTYKSMQNQEIGLHCYRHKVFNDFRKNNLNLQKGFSILKKNGIENLGFASPFGVWNNALCDSINKFNFKYSSEFGLDYDNLPFFPIMNKNKFSNVLQIPIHPICVGSLKNSKHSTEQIKKYFENLIKNHTLNNLPIFIYDHPKQFEEKILKWLFNKINELNFPSLTLVDYAEWWKQRLKIKWKAKIKNNKIILDYENWNDSVFLKISKLNMKSIIINKNNLPDIKNFKWEIDNPILPLNNIEQLNKINRKIITNNILQFYWKNKL